MDGSRALRATAAVAMVLLFATIVAGGYVAGTEGEGTPNQPILGAHLACGEQFPTCLNKFMPFSYGRLVDIQLTHRLFMYLTDDRRRGDDGGGAGAGRVIPPFESDSFPSCSPPHCSPCRSCSAR